MQYSDGPNMNFAAVVVVVLICCFCSIVYDALIVTRWLIDHITTCSAPRRKLSHANYRNRPLPFTNSRII